jgi:membrane associated rhomboid family serine protease
MGLYDRDYVREEEQGFFLGGDLSMVARLMILNVGIFLVDVLFFDGQLGKWMAVKADLFHKPWNCWQLLTAGFAHDHSNILHVGFNMFGLWLFGRDTEAIYGRKEFLRIYLSMVIFSSLAWVIVTNITSSGVPFAQMPEDRIPRMLGASGAVNGIMVLFALHYPRRLLYIWGVFPVPVWLICTFMVGTNVLGFNRSMNGVNDERIAYEAHLAGALFAFIYYKTGWNLGRLIPDGFSLSRWRSRPKLKIHKPTSGERDLTQEVDRILEKISAQGESSLTSAERRTLEEASRRYQQRRQ